MKTKLEYFKCTCEIRHSNTIVLCEFHAMAPELYTALDGVQDALKIKKGETLSFEQVLSIRRQINKTLEKAGKLAGEILSV